MARTSVYANHDVTIADCIAHDNSGDSLYTENHSGSGILLENTDQGIIDGPGYMIWNYAGAPHSVHGNVIRRSISFGDGRKHAYGAIHAGGDGTPLREIEIGQNMVIVRNAAGSSPKPLWIGGSPNKNIAVRRNLYSDLRIPMVEIEGEQGVIFEHNAYWSKDGVGVCQSSPFNLCGGWARTGPVRR